MDGVGMGVDVMGMWSKVMGWGADGD